MPYRRRFPVRFGDIDEAGIVYYPRYFDYLHQAFEDYWSEHLGLPYPQVLGEERTGYPAVHIETDFRGPLKFGDRFDIEVRVEHIGNRSVRWAYRGYREGEEQPFLEALVTTACVDMDTFRSKEIPQDHRERIEAGC